MKSGNLLYSLLIAASTLNCSTAFAVKYNSVWKQLDTKVVPSKGTQQLFPSKFLAYHLDDATMQQQLSSLSSDPAAARIMDLPMPDGSFRSFKVWQSASMEPALAAKYPEIKTFTAEAVDNKFVTAKLDFTVWGFHAMIYDGANTYLVDPYSFERDGYYICYYKRDYQRPANNKIAQCGVADEWEDMLQKGRINMTTDGSPMMKVNGTLKRYYRLALACTAEYAIAVTNNNATKPGALSAMTTSLNRVNGVFERELSLHMDLVANNDQLIFLTIAGEPYSDGNGPSMQTQNQTTCDNLIGPLNYDLGHVFSTWSAGGVSELGCACQLNKKAQSVTGQTNPVGDVFDIDFVIHEFGHEFGAHHTFNSKAGSCSGVNLQSAHAYEPGGGTTIMAYAGICGQDNLQQHSDDYFHLESLREIADFMVSPTGAGLCGTTSAASNNPPTAAIAVSSYFIPYLTPFELTAPDAADADHDSLTYCWEQWDLGDAGATFFDVHQNGPIFRSFRGTASPTRVFPKMDMIRNNVTSYLGEKLPDVERALKFRYTVRDMIGGWGCTNISDDSVTLLVVNTNTPFAVTSPNIKTDYWRVGGTYNVTWDVSKTDQSPINASKVDIYLSVDDGQTYPTTLATGVPNTGSASITVPTGTNTNSARVKVKGAGNVFFDISNESFIINEWPDNVQHLLSDNDVAIYPTPAKDRLHVKIADGKIFDITITNAIGQKVWQDEASGQANININGWVAGVYNISFNGRNGEGKLVKRFVVQ